VATESIKQKYAVILSADVFVYSHFMEEDKVSTAQTLETVASDQVTSIEPYLSFVSFRRTARSLSTFEKAGHINRSYTYKSKTGGKIK